MALKFKEGDIVTVGPKNDIISWFNMKGYYPSKRTKFKVISIEEEVLRYYDEEGDELIEEELEYYITLEWINKKWTFNSYNANWKKVDLRTKEEQLVKKIQELWERQSYVKEKHANSYT